MSAKNVGVLILCEIFLMSKQGFVPQCGTCFFKTNIYKWLQLNNIIYKRLHSRCYTEILSALNIMATKSTEKAKLLIDLLSSSELGAAGLETLHILSGYPKPTITRIMNDLQELGVIYRRLADKRYVVMSFDSEHFDPVYLLARDVAPLLRMLHQKSGLLSDLVMVRDGSPVIIESNFSLCNIRAAAGLIIGSRPSPLLSAAGRALLAERNDVVVLQESSLTCLGCLSSLEQERHHGVYSRVENTWEYCFPPPFVIAAKAIPIRHQGETVAALSIYADSERFKATDSRSDVASFLLEAGMQIERLLEKRSRLYRRAAISFD